MLHPEEVVRAIEGSGTLGRLARRVCKPLDNRIAANGISVDDQHSEYDDSSAQDSTISLKSAVRLSEAAAESFAEGSLVSSTSPLRVG
jgi:hypothetical protein